MVSLPNSDDLQVAWQQACESFAATTHRKLDSRPVPTPEQIIGIIKAEGKKEKKDNPKLEAVKEAVQKSITCIVKLGSVALQGASMVLGGPSSVCMNVISIFVQAAADYGKIFKGIDELFSRISDALERFQEYLAIESVIDPPMKRIANELLIRVVKIFDLSYKLLHRNKPLQFLKTLTFQDDGGVPAELDKLARFAERESQMRATLTYGSAKRTENNVVTTLERVGETKELAAQSLTSLRKLEANGELKRQREDVLKLLSVPEETYEEEFRECIETAVDGTGDWLLEEASFKQWADPSGEFDSILFFLGGEGRGKTYLMSAAIKILLKQYPQRREDTARISVATHYFKRLEKETKKGSKSSNGDSQSVGKALRALAWQITLNDPIYRKDILNQGKSSLDSGDTAEDLWNKLFASYHESDATFLLLIDGIDHLEESHKLVLFNLLKSFRVNPKGQLRLRLVLSGRADMLEKLKSDLDIPVVTVDVALKNGDAIAKYTREKVDNVQILRGSAAHVQTLKEEVYLSLTENARGDFINIDVLLQEIGQKQRPDEIRDILQKVKAGKGDRSGNFAREIERCNQTFGVDDIQDLSVLLRYVICAFYPLSIEQLEAVLYIRNHNPSLLPLYDRIRDKFSIFFQLREAANKSDAEVTVKADTITEYFESISSSADKGPSSLSEDVNEVEVRVVQHFLKTICDNVLYEKFRFEEFFHNKRSKSTINPDLETAHANILRDCLQVLHGELGDHANGIKDYATWYFPDHLIKVDLSLIDPPLKAEIGRRLVTILKDETAIEQWQASAWCWIFENSYVETTTRWFRDSAVVKNIKGDDKIWVDTLISSTKPGGDLLEHVARFKAKAWLEGKGEVTLKDFRWIRCYLNKLDYHKNPESTELFSQSDFWSDEIEGDEVETAATWARKLLGLIEGYDFKCRLAETFSLVGRYELAIDKFQQAVSLVKDHWKADSGLAFAYAGHKLWDSAILTIGPVIKSLQNHDIDTENREVMLKQSLRSVALWYRKIRKFDEARMIYDQILEENGADYYSICFEVMILLEEQDKHADAMEFLLQMKQQTDESTRQDKLTQMFFELADRDDYHIAMVKAARKFDHSGTIKESYQNALTFAESAAREKDGDSAKLLVACLMYYFGIALYDDNPGDHEVLAAIRLWKQVLAPETVAAWHIQRRTTEKLALVYISQARSAGHASDLARSNLQRLEDLFSADNSDDTDKRFLVSRYHSILNDRDKAMDCLKPYIELGIALLSDEDPTNDWQGYIRLAMGFMFSGDDVNALAAWSLIGPTTNLPVKEPPDKAVLGNSNETASSLTTGDTLSNGGSIDDHKPVSVDVDKVSASMDGAERIPGYSIDLPPTPLKRSPTSMVRKKPQGPINYICDGVCDTKWTYADDINVCKDCLCVQFCGSCLNILQKGDLTKNLCDRKHDFLYVPKWDWDSAEKIGEDNVSVGGEVIPVKQWLDMIRKNWGIASQVTTDA